MTSLRISWSSLFEYSRPVCASQGLHCLCSHDLPAHQRFCIVQVHTVCAFQGLHWYPWPPAHRSAFTIRIHDAWALKNLVVWQIKAGITIWLCEYLQVACAKLIHRNAHQMSEIVWKCTFCAKCPSKDSQSDNSSLSASGELESFDIQRVWIEDSGLRRLIWVFAGRAWPKIHFLKLRLKWSC